VLDMFAYVRDSDGALVVGAGIPASWVSESPGVDVRSLPTPYGPLDLGITRSDRKIVMRVAGDFALPESGVVVPLQSEWLGRSIDVNGTRVEPGGDEIILHALPARITLDG
jgi:hypothetical protein